MTTQEIAKGYEDIFDGELIKGIDLKNDWSRLTNDLDIENFWLDIDNITEIINEEHIYSFWEENKRWGLRKIEYDEDKILSYKNTIYHRNLNGNLYNIDLLTEQEIIGTITYHYTDEEISFFDKDKYLNNIKEAFNEYGINGWKFNTITNNPQIRKAVADIEYGEYGEHNPHNLAWYEQKYNKENLEDVVNTELNKDVMKEINNYVTFLNDEFSKVKITFLEQKMFENENENILTKEIEKVVFEIEKKEEKYNIKNNLGETELNLNKDEIITMIKQYVPTNKQELEIVEKEIEKKVFDHTGIKRKEFVEKMVKDLEVGIKEVYTTEKWKNWLDFNSKFYGYSPRNMLLIFRQMPYATSIASMKDWNKKFERTIIKGQGKKGIKILAPIENKYKKLEYEKDKDGKIIIDENGNKKTIEKDSKYLSFIPVSVYDVSQTQGKEIPKITTELNGNVKNSAEILLAIEKTAKIKIDFEEINGNAKGYYKEDIDGNKKIVIRKGMSEEQTIKTAIHEMAHSILHNSKVKNIANIDRQTQEFQAESIAYLVCKNLDINTDDYSFNYLASWSNGKENQLLKDNLDVILKTSKEINNELSFNLKRVNLNICQNPLACEKYLKSSENLNKINNAEMYNSIIQKIDTISNDNIFIEINKSNYNSIKEGEIYSHKEFKNIFKKADIECNQSYKKQNLDGAFDKINFSVYFKKENQYEKINTTYKIGTLENKNYLDILDIDKNTMQILNEKINTIEKSREKNNTKNKAL